MKREKTKKLATETSQCFSKGHFSSYFCPSEVTDPTQSSCRQQQVCIPRCVPGEGQGTHGVHGSSDVDVHPHPWPVEADVGGNEEPSTGAGGVVSVLWEQ